ncbi:precorrin-2 dehydrogenase/sirohydrochlorin ferrochelatase family protein [Velocimicrobium porci]|uniref:precorrin-2 dehydrogenase n=1 Tax=Velocimicrobium porci TaxID=2606634 RepID=A0A6L5XY08_9FIRM|nr:bifunctional precorrin-2 dehydrogenase/sirohydrochlorin ferrochelatase [Velocimicrobium porci]MSS63341.1 bifunctional precorrin-2 dehydrogenase/sirohydrochlorin ferrochelatase [Velocimicrobium porci]
MGYFPMFIDMTGKKVLVIGGGTIATRRIRTLLEFKCDITVISLGLTAELKELSDQSKIRWKKREYSYGEIESEFLVIGATDNREVNHLVYLEAKKKGCLVNIIDCKEECDFYFPAVIIRDDIVIGVTASGTNHKAVKETAAWIRENLH